jgi:hypothetical protein
MSTREYDFDPDDNFAHGAIDDEDAAEDVTDGDIEALVWQWLLRINPGDDEAATQQLAAFREALGVDDAPDAVQAALETATDWRSSFRISENARSTLIDAIDTLSERFRVEIDWDVEDPTDDEALAGASTSALLEVAYDQLRVAGYTMWTWDTGDDTVAGVMAPRDDDEGMRVIGNALGLDVRPGAG